MRPVRLSDCLCSPAATDPSSRNLPLALPSARISSIMVRISLNKSGRCCTSSIMTSLFLCRRSSAPGLASFLRSSALSRSKKTLARAAAIFLASDDFPVCRAPTSITAGLADSSLSNRGSQLRTMSIMVEFYTNAAKYSEKLSKKCCFWEIWPFFAAKYATIGIFCRNQAGLHVEAMADSGSCSNLWGMVNPLKDASKRLIGLSTPPPKLAMRVGKID